MIKKFNTFEYIREHNYEDIKKRYHSLGDYVEHLYNVVDDKDTFSQILGKFLKLPKKKYETVSYKVGDYVLMEYWFMDILTPVKIKDKNGRKYVVTHHIEESKIKNAPDETITKADIISHYRKTEENDPAKNISTDIRISNSVNLLKGYDQQLLVKKLQDTFKVTEGHHFEIEEMKDMTLLGQTGFNTFLKVLTSLNLPNIKIDKENCPTDFFSIFVTEKINKERLLTILKRFRSMGKIYDILTRSNDAIRVYFGLSIVVNKIMLEYGIIKGEKRLVVGEFVVNQKNWVNLKERNNKPLKSLQEQIVNIELSDLKKLMKIKQDLTDFSPGYYHEKSNPYIENNTLTQGYFGTGKWKEGTITNESFNEIKTLFKEWVLTQKWGKLIVFRIIPDKFWVRVEIKLA